MAPGSLKGVQLVVADADAGRQELLDRGVEASEINVIDPRDGGTMFWFSDPDGNAGRCSRSDRSRERGTMNR